MVIPLIFLIYKYNPVMDSAQQTIMMDLMRMLESNKYNNDKMCLLTTDQSGLYVVAYKGYNGEKPDANVNDYIRLRKPVPSYMLESVRKGVNSINSILSSDCNEFVVIHVDYGTGKPPCNYKFMTFYDKAGEDSLDRDTNTGDLTAQDIETVLNRSFDLADCLSDDEIDFSVPFFSPHDGVKIPSYTHDDKSTPKRSFDWADCLPDDEIDFSVPIDWEDCLSVDEIEFSAPLAPHKKPAYKSPPRHNTVLATCSLLWAICSPKLRTMFSS